MSAAQQRVRIVTAIANKGQRYRVVFHGDGAYSVSVLRADGRPFRRLWCASTGKPMGLTAACAVRAALIVLCKI